MTATTGTTFEMMLAIQHAVAEPPAHRDKVGGGPTPFEHVHRQIMQYVKTIQHIEPT